MDDEELSQALDVYGNWVDEASSKEELLDVLYDIENDLLSEDDDDNEGGRQYSLRS